MKKLLLPILMVLLMGCTSSVEKLNGSWQCNAQATLSENNTPEIQKLLSNKLSKKFLTAMLQNMYINIDTKNKKMKLLLGKAEEDKPFTILSEKDNTIDVSIGKKNITFILIDDNTLHVKNMQEDDKFKVIVFDKANDN